MSSYTSKDNGAVLEAAFKGQVEGKGQRNFKLTHLKII